MVIARVPAFGQEGILARRNAGFRPFRLAGTQAIRNAGTRAFGKSRMQARFEQIYRIKIKPF